MEAAHHLPWHLDWAGVKGSKGKILRGSRGNSRAKHHLPLAPPLCEDPSGRGINEAGGDTTSQGSLVPWRRLFLRGTHRRLLPLVPAHLPFCLCYQEAQAKPHVQIEFPWLLVYFCILSVWFLTLPVFFPASHVLSGRHKMSQSPTHTFHLEI